jgi:hypothetical protein
MRRSIRIAGLAAWVVVIGGLLALFFFGLQNLKVRLETSDSFPEYSTYRADPKGLRAFYESLQSTDLVQVSRRLQSSKILPSGENRVLVLAGVGADQETVTDEDAALFTHWLQTGGRLIIALRPEKILSSKGQLAPGASQEEKEGRPFVPWQTLIRRWGADLIPVSETHASTVTSTSFGTLPRWLGRNSFDRLTSDWKVIAAQGNKNVIIERPFAQGSIVLLADTYPLSNEALAADRNTAFLLWLIDNRRGVQFEETHLGLSEQPGIMTLAQRYGLQGTLISIVAVLLLFIWKCQYTLVPRTRTDQNRSTVAGSSSDQVFLSLLQRTLSQKDLLGVCITTWLKTARPTSGQLADLQKFRSDSGEKRPVVEGYNLLTSILHLSKKL